MEPGTPSSEEPNPPKEVFAELQSIFEGPAEAVDNGVEDLCRTSPSRRNPSAVASR